MSYSVLVFGDFALDSRSVEAWKKARLDASELAKGDLGMLKEIVFVAEGATVESALARFPNEPLEFVRVEVSDGVIRFRGTLHEDEFRDIGPEVAAVAVAIGANGGRGELCFSSPEADFLSTVSVKGKRVSATSVDAYKNPTGAKLIAKARKSAAYVEVLNAITKAVEAIRGPSRAQAVPTQVTDDAAALRKCADTDAHRAETMAIEFAKARPVHERLLDAIAYALRERASDESLACAISLLEDLDVDDVTYSRVARSTLATSKNSEAGARVLALLEREAPRLKTVMQSPGISALIFSLGAQRFKPAVSLLKTLAKHAAFRRDAMLAIQSISKGSRATGFRVGPRGALIARKTKPRSKKRGA